MESLAIRDDRPRALFTLWRVQPHNPITKMYTLSRSHRYTLCVVSLSLLLLKFKYDSSNPHCWNGTKYMGVCTLLEETRRMKRFTNTHMKVLFSLLIHWYPIWILMWIPCCCCSIIKPINRFHSWPNEPSAVSATIHRRLRTDVHVRIMVFIREQPTILYLLTDQWPTSTAVHQHPFVATAIILSWFFANSSFLIGTKSIFLSPWKCKHFGAHHNVLTGELRNVETAGTSYKDSPHSFSKEKLIAWKIQSHGLNRTILSFQVSIGARIYLIFSAQNIVGKQWYFFLTNYTNKYFEDA